MTADDALRDAYLQTTYRVLAAPEAIDIRIGQRNSMLDRLLRDNGVQDWAFVTASNPRSRRLPDHENAKRNAEMKHALQQDGWRLLDGIGLPCESGWQPENSVLILGIDRDAAMKVALRWEQNAIVCGTVGHPAELAWAI